MFYEESLRRYSCRRYADREIPTSVLTEVLKIVPTVPTANNAQAEQVYVFQSPEAKAKLEAFFPYRFNNPIYLLVTMNEEGVWHNRQFKQMPNTLVDGTIVLTHLMFQAEDFGLKTCWIGNFDVAAVKETFLPENEYPVGILTLGYPAEDDEPSPRHFDRKPLESFIHYL